MAMEYRHTVHDAHPKPILCVQYNPFRREIYTAGEGCKEIKVLFSCSIDGKLIAWGSNGKILQHIQTGSPMYTLAYNSRRQQIMAGQNRKVRLFQLINSDDNHGTTDVLERRNVACTEHSDVVSCIVSCEGRFYSAGYDRKIIIYDVPHHGDLKLRVSSTIRDAHDAAISCMVFGKDADNSWLITGSFDRVVKLWSLDGNLMQRFDGFNDTISSLCYVVPTQTLWVTASSVTPVVSDFVRTDDERFHPAGGTFAFKYLLFIPETNEVVAVSTRRSVVIWRYNSVAPLTVLPGHADIVECLTFTSKEPLLIFSGGDDGIIRKWERLQLNTFMYSQETLTLPKEEFMDAAEAEPEHDDAGRRQHDDHGRRGITKISLKSTKGPKQGRMGGGQAARQRSSKRLDASKGGAPGGLGSGTEGKNAGGASGQDAARSGGVPGAHPSTANSALSTTMTKTARPGIVSLFYYEDLDYLISGYEDSRICVWGYNEETIKFEPEMVSGDHDPKDPTANPSGNGGSGGNMAAVPLGAAPAAGLAPQMGSDSVSNRVAGMALKATLLDHKDAVTGLVCFQQDGVHWMISAGWDRRICVWDLKNVKLHDVFRNNQPQFAGTGREELAADGIILSLDYSPERNEFGYASSDKLAYIRRFSPNGTEMTLTSVLQGHEAEVTQIQWHRKESQWITGSEDRTLRIWPADGIPCLRVINNDGPVTALCIDSINGCLITGSQDKVIRVFDIDKKDEIVQKNMGHSDEIRSLIHIPARNQYVSASWDNTVRIWNAYLKKGQRRIAAKANMAFYANAQEKKKSPQPTFSELNPLIVPKLLTKPVFVKDFILEKPPTKDEDYGTTAEKTALEEELRQTFNDLDAMLNADVAQRGPHGQKSGGKPRIAKTLPRRKTDGQQ
ncbi:quinon protein alcohol dehydrogenase-like superfamily [Entophlyctis helioformis]|nr:quinon protein alcohol dehydrogenase-like superfamily [Entophlyctis helioformis]